MGQLDPPFHSLVDPPGVFLLSGGIAAPLLPLHSVGIGDHSGGLAAPRVTPHYPGVVTSQPRRLPFSPPCCFCMPWNLSVSPLSAVPEVPFPPPLLPSLPPTRIPPAPLSCVPPGDAVSRAGYSSTSPDSTSDVASLLPLSPLHPSLSSPLTPPLPTSLVSLRPLALTHAPLPLSHYRHLRPLGRYQRPGPGAGARGWR